MIASTVDWELLLAIGLLLALALILGYRLLDRDPRVRRTRYGFFVERDRFEDDEEDEMITQRWSKRGIDDP